MFNKIKQYYSNKKYKGLILDLIYNYGYLAKNSNLSNSTYDEFHHSIDLDNGYKLTYILSRSFMGGSGYMITKNNTIIVKYRSFDPYIDPSKYKNIYLDIIDNLKLKEKEYLEKRYSINNILK